MASQEWSTRLEKRVLIAFDFDHTLSLEYMEGPLYHPNFAWMREKYGHLGIQLDSGLDYFNIVAALQPGVSRGIGYLQQMVWDKDDVFKDQLTRENFNRVGSLVKLAPGIPEGLSSLKEEWAAEGIDVSYVVISVGIKDIIAGTRAAPLFDDIFASEFFYDDQGNVKGLKNAITPFDKSRGIIEIVKGGANALDERKSHSQYRFDYRNVIFVGDGFSDVSGFSFGREKGGICVAVYNPGDTAAFTTLLETIPTRVNYIVPRDYSKASDTMRTLSRVVRLMTERTCGFNQPILHEFRKGRVTDPELSRIINDHLDACRYCDTVNSLRWIEPK